MQASLKTHINIPYHPHLLNFLLPFAVPDFSFLPIHTLGDSTADHSSDFFTQNRTTFNTQLSIYSTAKQHSLYILRALLRQSALTLETGISCGGMFSCLLKEPLLRLLTNFCTDVCFLRWSNVFLRFSEVSWIGWVQNLLYQRNGSTSDLVAQFKYVRHNEVQLLTITHHFHIYNVINLKKFNKSLINL